MSIIWQKCLEKFKNTVPIKEYSQWISPIKATQREKKLILTAQSNQALTWINNHLKIAIISIIADIDKSIEVVIKVKKDKKINLNTLVDKLSAELIPEYTFENMVLGDANQFAYHAGIDISKNIKTPQYSPFIIYGHSGLGKTHLLQAIGHRVKEIHPELKIIHTSLINFVKNITSGIRHKHINTIKKCYQVADLLLVDDIHMLAEKEKSQEEFFHIFNYLFDNKKQIILTCDQVPKNIGKIEQRLISRFSQGLSLEINPPELEMRAAILINKAKQLNIFLNEEIALFIATKFTDNVRELEGVLKRLKAATSFSNIKTEDLTIEQIKLILKDLLQDDNKIISINLVQKTICRYFGINIANLISKKRIKELVYPRQLAMHLCKELTNLSLAEIGLAFKRDHTTVIYASKKISKELTNKKTTKEDYKTLLLKIK